MFVKSLTMWGFKSFADKTVLEFEPGITVLVGPNGSGKSNVVDALAWVLGTRSPTQLRGGELADVIFAGSPTRPPLGRAKVEIIIDNSQGQLGSDSLGTAGSAKGFSEVAISREILATGESTYRINGAECRLLDIRELLSDAGLGRELHTVIGQGQLESIFHAKPDQRRALTEEAAGIVKFRRRRERAGRKLEQVDRHVSRLAGLLGEQRRRLAPLKRQAEAAGQHARLRSELRTARRRLGAVEVAQLRHRLSVAAAAEKRAATRRAQLEEKADELAQHIETLTDRLNHEASAVDEARSRTEELGRLRERLTGTSELIAARRRHLTEVTDQIPGPSPAELRGEADRLAAERVRHAEECRRARRAVEQAAAATRRAEQARREHDRRVAEASRVRAAQRERRARREAEQQARREALDATQAEVARLEDQQAHLDARVDRLTRRVTERKENAQRLRSRRQSLSAAAERARSEVTEAEQQRDTARESYRHLERRHAATAARAETLRAACVDPSAGAAALTDEQMDGLLGALVDHVQVAAGGEAAVAGALGPLGEAVVARDVEAARRAVARLREIGADRATILPVGLSTAVPSTAGPARQPQRTGPSPTGCRPVSDLVRPRPGAGDTPLSRALLAALRRVLGSTYVADDWDQAVALHERHPELTFVTHDGDVAGPRGMSGGSRPESSPVVAASVAEEAEQRTAELSGALRRVEAQVAAADDQLRERRSRLAQVTEDLNVCEAEATATADELSRADEELDHLVRERDANARRRAELDDSLDRLRRRLAELEAAEDEQFPQPGGGRRSVPATEPDRASREDDPVAVADRLAQAEETARREEIEARVKLDRLEQRVTQVEQAAAA